MISYCLTLWLSGTLGLLPCLSPPKPCNTSGNGLITESLYGAAA